MDDPVKAEDLGKDVAGFANAKTGGLLLVCFATRKEHDREVLDQVRQVPRAGGVGPAPQADPRARDPAQVA